jgi:sigma-B regulation protein RsbU (phosphoserine phosphatase)
MTDSSVGSATESQPYPLQCMEIIGSNRATERPISSPGLDFWVASRPYEGDVGGDVHYISMCGSGRVTRLAMADVSGHGLEADQTAQWLRNLMRKHINLLDQTQLAQAINRELPRASDDGRFATVLFVTYFVPTDHLIVCNAGHPRPIWFSKRLVRWQLLDEHLPDTGPSIREEKARYRLKPVSNLPLGIIEPTDYHQFAVKLANDDLVLVYTDALIEASNPEGEMLTETGLLRLAEQIEISNPEQVGRSLLGKVEEWRGHRASEDDQTLVVLRHNGADAPKMSLASALKTTARMLGLSSIYRPE